MKTESDQLQKKSALAGLSVLVVDDAEDNRALLCRQLSKFGAVVDTAENGFEAISKAVEFGYDIVVMDLNMPIMDGSTAASRLRAARFSQPIILLTACDDSVLGAIREQKIFDEILLKPQSSVELIETLVRHSTGHAHYIAAA